MSLTATAADRASPAGRSEPAAAVHQVMLERAFGRIFSAFVAVTLAAAWFTSVTLGGQRHGNVLPDLLLSVLLISQAIRALRRPPAQRDLYLMGAITAALLLASRVSAVPGISFAVGAPYWLVTPVAAAWTVWSARFAIPVPVLLIVLATGVWNPGGGLPVEQAVSVLAIVACAFCATRLMRAGARRADADADELYRLIAAQDAALAAEETERRAANTVHDDVLGVLRAISADRQLPWSLLVSKAQTAQQALARRVVRGTHGSTDLKSALRRQAGQVAPELDVRCDIDVDLNIPSQTVEALSAAAGEALRNVAAHARVHKAALTVRGSRSGGVTVIISDDGIGFDPALVGPASTGLRNSVRARMSDAGGRAEIVSALGQGTSVVLTWDPPQSTSDPATDPLNWTRRMAPSRRLILAGFMLPLLLPGLVFLCLCVQDMRWLAAATAVFAGFVGLAAISARYLSQVRMTRSAAIGLTVANTVLVAVGSLAVAPVTSDSSAYWVATGSVIVIAAIYFIRGPVSGLAALALDMVALTVGLLATSGATSLSVWVSILMVPVVGAGVATGARAAIRGLSRLAESQLAGYCERLRLEARAEAISRIDTAALDNARRVAGPVLSAVISSLAPNPDLRLAAALANATLRDELLAPGFLTANLAERIREARIAGVRVTVDVAGQGEAAFVGAARRLLVAALSSLGAGDEVILQVHPSAKRHAALLILHLRSSRPGHATLRRVADEYRALVSGLDDGELLIRLQPALECADPGPAHFTRVSDVRTARQLEACGRAA